jgi:hypothetical protein
VRVRVHDGAQLASLMIRDCCHLIEYRIEPRSLITLSSLFSFVFLFGPASILTAGAPGELETPEVLVIFY